MAIVLCVAERRHCESRAVWVFGCRDVCRKHYRRGFKRVVVGAFNSQGAEDQWGECRRVSLAGQNGKARAGLGLDKNGEVGLVLMSRDGNRKLAISPDDQFAVKLSDESGRVLWSAP